MGVPPDDPLGQRPAGPARGGDADRVEARRDEEVAHLRRLAQDELVVGGEALRSVVELAYPRLRQRRDAQHRAVHQHGEVLPVLLEQLELERVGDLVRRDPRLGLGLEAADHQAAHLLLEVGVAVGVAQHGQVGVHAVDRVGHHVEVLRGVQRHVDPGERAHLLGPLPGAVHHDLRRDVAGVRPHPGDPARGDGDAEHAGALEDPRAALPRAAGQRRGEVDRVGLAVAGQPDRAHQVVGPHDRVAVRRLRRGEQLALQAERRRGRGGAPQLRHPRLRPRHRDPAAPLEPRRQPGFPLQLAVELSRILNEACSTLIRPQLAHQPGGVPGGAAGQLALLEQDQVGPAELGQVVGHAGPDDAAADDDGARLGWKCVGHR